MRRAVMDGQLYAITRQYILLTIDGVISLEDLESELLGLMSEIDPHDAPRTARYAGDALVAIAGMRSGEDHAKERALDALRNLT